MSTRQFGDAKGIWFILSLSLSLCSHHYHCRFHLVTEFSHSQCRIKVKESKPPPVPLLVRTLFPTYFDPAHSGSPDYWVSSGDLGRGRATKLLFHFTIFCIFPYLPDVEVYCTKLTPLPCFVAVSNFSLSS
jgi:hypothetical protein